MSDKDIRNKLGIYDASYREAIVDNKPAWVGTDLTDGEQVIIRKDLFMAAYVIHDIGRYFSRKKMDFSKEGSFVAEVKFKVHLFADPSVCKDNITLKVPYEIKLSYNSQAERMDTETGKWVSAIQNKTRQK
jgi:hypothetical protein